MNLRLGFWFWVGLVWAGMMSGPAVTAAGLDGIGLAVAPEKFLPVQECFAWIEVPAEDWKRAEALLSQRGTLVGLSLSTRVQGPFRRSVARGIFTFAGTPQIVIDMGTLLREEGLPALPLLTRVTVDLFWGRYCLTGATPSDYVRLGYEFGKLSGGAAGKPSLRAILALATQAWKDPYGFTSCWFPEECRFILGSTSSLAGKTWMDTLLIRIQSDEPGQPDTTVFEDRVILRGSGKPFQLAQDDLFPHVHSVNGKIGLKP
jgi:hypothetical protein